ncbi:MAG: acyl-ACP--UDP-N-acetylglucosamine O-acyltransferase [Desulfovibrionaceae bacterium]|nr:acyl-ACP--UDP-N-acetylglucosamine O-acyltransferase [Desulfovibrionaceae bacterium]MDD4953009.1 acyl-ACP--UDP-N-acetylglucosamine O-acyltransferase [Desulfovibrionaceae bacterium]
MATDIHPTAIIGPKALIGQDVVIGPYCVVEDGVEIGDRSRLEAFSQVKRFTSMGPGNHIHSYACIGDEPQHLAFKGEETRVVIGQANDIREYVTIHRGTAGGPGRTVVGSHCMLMAYVHIAHDCRLGDHVIMANASSLAGHVEIGDHVVVNGMSGVQQYTRVGDYAFLGGMSGFAQDVPPYMLAYGIRAGLYGPNLIGLKRHGFSAQAVQALKKAYKIIFRSGLQRDEALARAAAELPGVAEVERLLEFLRTAQRGVTPDANKNGNGA